MSVEVASAPHQMYINTLYSHLPREIHRLLLSYSSPPTRTSSTSHIPLDNIIRSPWLPHVSLTNLLVRHSPHLTLLPEQLRTTVTDLLKINHPIMLAGMNVAAGPKLAAAVTNAGGLGVIGGVGYTPDMLREQIAELKGFLKDKNAPFGVDLLIPQVGGNARKTK